MLRLLGRSAPKQLRERKLVCELRAWDSTSDPKAPQGSDLVSRNGAAESQWSRHRSRARASSPLPSYRIPPVGTPEPFSRFPG